MIWQQGVFYNSFLADDALLDATLEAEEADLEPTLDADEPDLEARLEADDAEAEAVPERAEACGRIWLMTHCRPFES